MSRQIEFFSFAFVNSSAGGSKGWGWLRGLDLNQRPLGYEPNELPDCSTPHMKYIELGWFCQHISHTIFLLFLTFLRTLLCVEPCGGAAGQARPWGKISTFAAAPVAACASKARIYCSRAKVSRGSFSRPICGSRCTARSCV